MERAPGVYETEEELVGALRRHERPACAGLVKRYASRLYRVALQITGQAQDAEDVLQESLIKACGNVDSFEARGGSTLGAWLRRIVLNTALMHLRRRKPNVVSLTAETGPEQTTLLDEIADPGEAPVDVVLSRELRDRIDDAVLELPDTLRAAIVLRDIEGLSTADAAASLGITETALKVRLHRARLALREALAPYVGAAGPHDHTGAGHRHDVETGEAER